MATVIVPKGSGHHLGSNSKHPLELQQHGLFMEEELQQLIQQLAARA